MTDNLLSGLEELPQSGDDLINMAKCLGLRKVKFILYEDLKKHKSIGELFGGSQAIYILLQIKNPETGEAEAVGHWVAFIHHIERNIYYYYDPYGLSIEEEIALTHDDGLIKKFTSQAKVEVNKIQHQKFADDISTCGRHCVLRSIFWHLDNQQYDKLIFKSIKHKLEPDEIVALITGLISDSDEPLKKFYNKDR